MPRFTWEYVRLPVLPIYTAFSCYLTCTLYKMNSDMCVSVIGSFGPLVPGWPNIGIGDIKIRLYSVSGSRFIIFNVLLLKLFEENIFW